MTTLLFATACSTAAFAELPIIKYTPPPKIATTTTPITTFTAVLSDSAGLPLFGDVVPYYFAVYHS
jgi:hypothetical protein